MNFKKWWALCACFALCFMLISLALPVRSSADSFYNDEGYFTVTSTSYIDYPELDYRDLVSTPVVSDDTHVPDGYSLIGKGCYIYPSQNYQLVYWIYANASASPFPIQISDNNGSSYLYVSASSGNFYMITNSVYSDGRATFYNHTSNNNANLSGICSLFVPLVNRADGSPIVPEEQINFTLNTAIINYNVAFNSQINIGNVSSVDYYIFPSSTSITSGTTSTVVSTTPASELSEFQRQTILEKFGSAINQLLNDLGGFISDISSPSVSVSSSSCARSSSLFDPNSYGVSYEKIGSGRLYPSSGGSISISGSLSLKDMVSSHTGVYVNSALKLVAVVDYSNKSFIATFDFNPSAIIGGSPVPPSTLEGEAPYPDFQHPNSDFKDLADYLKGLFDINNDNSIRNNNNLLANLMAIPWSNFIGTGFANGFANVLPELSFSLDSLFDSLFDKYSAPTTEQINSLISDVTEERAYIRQKLAFVSDVKQEVFFIHSTFVSAGDNPRPFTVTLPDFMMGNKVHGHQEALVRYDLISEGTRQSMHNVIIVFCSLAVVMHIWLTLPSTVGSMPKGD